MRGAGLTSVNCFIRFVYRDSRIANYDSENRDFRLWIGIKNMKNGQVTIKPQDLLVLLKIVALKENPWKSLGLANDLFLSPSEISESLHRNYYAGLLDSSKKKVYRQSLLGLILHGVKYVFPQRPGPVSRGIATAHSAPPLSDLILSEKGIYIWEDDDGDVRGETIIPLYPTVPKAAKKDPELYELLALVDAIRIGKAREVHLAGIELKKRLHGI